MRIAVAAVLISLLAPSAAGQDYRLESSVVSGGGQRLTSSGFACGLSLGQGVASGQLSSAGYLAVLGFWNRGFRLIGIAEPPAVNPELIAFGLGPCEPNPVRSQAAIRYSLTAPGHVRLEVVNRAGRVVGVLVDRPQAPGSYRLRWDISMVGETRLANGVYFLRLRLGDRVAVSKAVVTR